MVDSKRSALDTIASPLKKQRLESDPSSAALAADQAILTYLATSASTPSLACDRSWLAAQTSHLETLKTTNQDLREQYASEPLRFLDSEGELHDAIKPLSAVATVDEPDAMLAYFSLHTAPVLLDLLANHSNADIKEQVLRVLSDVCEMEDQPAVGVAMVKLGIHTVLGTLLTTAEPELALLILGILILLVNSPKHEAATLFGCLSIQAYVEARVAEPMPQTLDHSRLALKQYSIEYLFSITQENATALREEPFASSMVDALLVNLSAVAQPAVLSVYAEVDEFHEIIENTVSLLCLVVHVPAYKAVFASLQGVELLLKVVQTDALYFTPAWGHETFTRVVQAYLLGAQDNAASAEAFVNAGGLKPLYQTFDTRYIGLFKRGRPASLKRTYERVLSITASLLKCTSLGSVERLRLLNKLLENDGFKVKVLVSNAVRLTKRLAGSEYQTELGEAYVSRLSLGLTPLQKTCVVLAWLLVEDDTVRELVEAAYFEVTKGTAEKVRDLVAEVLREYRLEFTPVDGDEAVRLENEDYLDMVEMLIHEVQNSDQPINLL